MIAFRLACRTSVIRGFPARSATRGTTERLPASNRTMVGLIPLGRGGNRGTGVVVLVTGSTVREGAGPVVVGRGRVDSVSDTTGTTVPPCWVGVAAEGGVVRVGMEVVQVEVVGAVV